MKTLNHFYVALMVALVSTFGGTAHAVLPTAATETQDAVSTAFTDFGTMLAAILPAALLITVAFVAYRLLTKGLKLGK